MLRLMICLIRGVQSTIADGAGFCPLLNCQNEKHVLTCISSNWKNRHALSFAQANLRIGQASICAMCVCVACVVCFICIPKCSNLRVYVHQLCPGWVCICGHRKCSTSSEFGKAIYIPVKSHRSQLLHSSMRCLCLFLISRHAWSRPHSSIFGFPARMAWSPCLTLPGRSCRGSPALTTGTANVWMLFPPGNHLGRTSWKSENLQLVSSFEDLMGWGVVMALAMAWAAASLGFVPCVWIHKILLEYRYRPLIARIISRKLKLDAGKSKVQTNYPRYPCRNLGIVTLSRPAPCASKGKSSAKRLILQEVFLHSSASQKPGHILNATQQCKNLGVIWRNPPRLLHKRHEKMSHAQCPMHTDMHSMQWQASL